MVAIRSRSNPFVRLRGEYWGGSAQGRQQRERGRGQPTEWFAPPVVLSSFGGHPVGGGVD